MRLKRPPLLFIKPHGRRKGFSRHVSGLAATAEQNGVQKTALIVVGGFLGGEYERSKLYDPDFSTEYRKAQI